MSPRHAYLLNRYISQNVSNHEKLIKTSILPCFSAQLLESWASRENRLTYCIFGQNFEKKFLNNFLYFLVENPSNCRNFPSMSRSEVGVVLKKRRCGSFESSITQSFLDSHRKIKTLFGTLTIQSHCLRSLKVDIFESF